MTTNYLKTTFRSIRKNKSFVFINVLGIGIAVAFCITAYINYSFAVNFDTCIDNKDHIFRVNMHRNFQGDISEIGVAPLLIADEIRNNIGEVNQVTRYFPGNFNFKIKDDIFESNVAFTDPEFFKIFSFELISGNKNGLTEMANIFISDEMALKYFGDLNSVGKQITLLSGENKVEYVIGGIFKKLKLNNSFQFDAITNIYNYKRGVPDTKEDDWAVLGTTFVQIDDPTNVPLVESRLQEYIEIQNKAREDLKAERFYLETFDGMALRAYSTKIRNSVLRTSLPTPAIYVPAVMAAIILLIACFNFTNTSIAISSRRLKEIGIRKVMGSNRSQLIIQFLSESLIICFLGLALGLLLAEFLVPAYSNLWAFLELEVNYLENLNMLVFLTCLLIFTAVLSGGYPAFYISSFKPTTILKGTTKFAGTNLFSRSLLYIQYTFCVLSVLMGIGFISNANYQKSMDLGFQLEDILYHRVTSVSEYEGIKNDLEQNPIFSYVSGSGSHIFNRWYNDPIKFEGTEMETDVFDVSYDYIDIMNIEIISGRNFIKDSETDKKESIIVNEDFVKKMNWVNPIGQKVVWRDSVSLYVVGVIKDIYIKAYFNEIYPMMLKNIDTDKYFYIIANNEPGKKEEATSAFNLAIGKHMPNTVANVKNMTEPLEGSFRTNMNIVKMFLSLGIVAILLTSIGLYSFVSLNIIKRTKEIGVRKVLGASIKNLVQKLSLEFVIILSLACLTAIPAGLFLSGLLMNQIWDYYQEIGITIVAGTVILFYAIAAIILGYRILGAAKANPAVSLRTE